MLRNGCELGAAGRRFRLALTPALSRIREREKRSGVVAVEHSAQAAEEGAFFFAAGAVGEHAAGQAREWQRLEPDASGAGEGGEEEAFAAEEGVFEAADELDVEGDAWGEADDAAGVDLEGVAGAEVAFHERAAGVDECDAVAGEALHDEAFAAEESDADLFLEGDADLGALGGAEEGVLLADHFAAQLTEAHGDDLAGVGGGEGDLLAAVTDVGEGGHEHGFAGEEALSGGLELV